jgi:hypothetical protein
MAPLSRIALFSCAAAALVGCAVQALETDEYVETFAPTDTGRVVFDGLDGDIVVRGMEVDEVEIRGTQYSIGATRREARKGLKHAVLDAEYAAGDLKLSFNPPFALDGLVDLELDRVSTLPQAMSVAASVESGDLEISGLEGALDLESEHGDIDVDDVGPETVRAVAGDGDIRYSVGLFGFYIECAAASGTVTIDDALLAAGAVRYTEIDGAIVLTYGDTLKRVELSATGGDIEVALNDSVP